MSVPYRERLRRRRCCCCRLVGESGEVGEVNVGLKSGGGGEVMCRSGGGVLGEGLS